MISSYDKVLTLCQILASLLTSVFYVVCSSIFKNVGMTLITKWKNRKKSKKLPNLMTSLSDDDVITQSLFISECTCQTIIFQMCGPPLLYLERCGHKMTPRFPAPVNRLSIDLVQSYLAKFFRLRELQSGKGLSVQICSLGSQESLCKISTNFQLKKMCYSNFKFEVMWAPLKFYYRRFFWS